MVSALDLHIALLPLKSLVDLLLLGRIVVVNLCLFIYSVLHTCNFA